MIIHSLTSSSIYAGPGVFIHYSSSSTGVKFYINSTKLMLASKHLRVGLVQLEGKSVLHASTSGIVDNLIWLSGEIALPSTVSIMKFTSDTDGAKSVTGTLVVAGQSTINQGSIEIAQNGVILVTENGVISAGELSGNFTGEGLLQLVGYFNTLRSFEFPMFFSSQQGTIFAYGSIIIQHAQIQGLTTSGNAALYFYGTSNITGHIDASKGEFHNYGTMKWDSSDVTATLYNFGLFTPMSAIKFGGAFMLGACNSLGTVDAAHGIDIFYNSSVPFGCTFMGSGRLTIMQEIVISSTAISNLYLDTIFFVCYFLKYYAFK